MDFLTFDYKNILLAGLILAFLSPTARAEQELRIIDVEGKTQSVVELDDSAPDRAQATVRVSLASMQEQAPGLPPTEVQGVELSLIKIVNGREGDVVQTAKTFKNGVATFNAIPPGVYKVRTECDQMVIANAVVSGDNLINRANVDVPLPEVIDQIHVMDRQGTTRAMAELPGSQTGSLSVTIADSSKDNAPAKGLRVLLVEVEDQTEEELEVYAGQMTDDDGNAQFSDVPGGMYKLRVECSGYGIDGVKFAGAGVISCLCPYNIITSAPGAVSELATPMASATTTTATTTTTTTTGLSLGAAEVAAPAAISPAIAPDVLKPVSGSTPTPQEQ